MVIILDQKFVVTRKVQSEHGESLGWESFGTRAVIKLRQSKIEANPNCPQQQQQQQQKQEELN